MTDTNNTNETTIKTEIPSDANLNGSDPSQSFTHSNQSFLLHTFFGLRLFDLLCIVFMCAGMGWVYWYCVNNYVLGFTHDDGIYAIAGKALAQGDGFWLLQMPGEGMPQVKYPILYPLLLSIAWTVNPNFPANLPLMNALTITFSVTGLGLMAGWFRFQKKFPLWLSLLLMPVVATNFFFLFYTSSIMSEGPYFCFSIVTLWFAERAFTKKPTRDIHWKDILILCLLCTLTFHTRILGVTLITAIGIWMLLQRQFKWAFIYGGITAAFTVLPWGLYLWLTRPHDVDAINHINVFAYSNYAQELLTNTESDYWQRVYDSFGFLVYRLFEAMFNIFPHFFTITSKILPDLQHSDTAKTIIFYTTVIGAYILFGYYISQFVSWFRQVANKTTPLKHAFTLPVVYLFIYLAIIMFWSYDSQIGRFILMLSPVFWYYFFKPIVELKNKAPYFRNVLIGFFLVLTLSSMFKTINSIRLFNEYKLIDTNGEMRNIWIDYGDAFEWIKNNTAHNAILASHNDAVFYLYTQRQTFFLFPHSLHLMKEYNPDDPLKQLWETILANKINYLILDPYLIDRRLAQDYNPLAQMLLNQNKDHLHLVYESPLKRVIIFKVIP